MRCPVKGCMFETQKKQRIIFHSRLHHIEQIEIYYCPNLSCPYDSPREEAVRRHISNSHYLVDKVEVIPRRIEANTKFVPPLIEPPFAIPTLNTISCQPIVDVGFIQTMLGNKDAELKKLKASMKEKDTKNDILKNNLEVCRRENRRLRRDREALREHIKGRDTERREETLVNGYVGDYFGARENEAYNCRF